ncbi:CARDB domain-containing protein [Halorientalis litorea]|uniref:CARDB domain-containing protein n=1 Tax=Halorientalis litorea TaxID=2931977 RepID=UPI001FF697F0|nr:CARDB domain-containing protein [Halorientalis litorea]
MKRRVVVVCALSVVALAALSGTAVAATAEERATNVSVGNSTVDAATETLEITQELRLTPRRPGEITVALQYGTPDNLVELETTLPPDATVTATDGFSRGDGGYVWDGETADPSVTYRLPANRTRDRSGPRSDGEYLFADTGPWALVKIPQVGASWTWRGGDRVTAARQTTVAGEGVAGDRMAFLGAHTERRRTANGQTFRLVVPEHANLASSPGDIFDSVTDASERLRVGTPDDSVLMIAAPTTVEWSVFGLQTGESDFWVRASERVDSANNVWVHELVHTRQEYEQTAETQWFTEASASYYAALFTLQQGRVGFDAFSDRLRAGERQSVILSDPATWSNDAPYRKGALVAGDIDRRVRLASDGGTLQSVLRALNAREDGATAAEFRRIVARVSDESVAAATDRYTTTTDSPSMWSSQAHERAFDTAIARLIHEFPRNGSGQRVDGLYRNGTVGGDPVRLATGERLTLDATVTNDGTAAGTYDTRLLVSGVSVDRYRGTVDPGAQTTVPVAHTFGSPGNYTLSFGGARRSVVVRDPVAPTVVGLDAAPTDPTVGDTLTLTVTVRNGGPTIAVGNVTLGQNGTAVATERVVLEPGERGRLTFQRPVRASGTYRFTVANQTTSVTVRDGGATDSSLPVDGPGFGAVTAVVAVLVTLLSGRRVRGN